jgi:two-component system sensor histidine kinase AgrC
LEGDESMNDLLLFWSNVLLVLLEVIVLVFFASVFFKKNLSRRKFGASVILLAISNITALALLDSHFWSKAFAVIIVDAIWLKIAYDDTIMQSIGIAIGFYSFVSVWDVLVLLAVSFLSKKAFSTYMENPMEYYLICYGVKCLELLLTVIIGLFAKNRFQFKNTTWKDWLRATLFPLTTIFCSVIFFQIYEVESAVGTELLLCEIILLFFDVMAIWILDYMDQQQAALQDNIILKRSIKQEKESMEALVEAYSDQRKKTHDFQNQLAVIYGLAQQESPNGEIIKYVEPLLKKELLPTLITKTGRNVVDILLTQKYSAAIKNQISFQMQLGDLSTFPLSDEELIVVLSNLLDNAFNACMAVSSFDERKVLLKMRTKEAAGFLYLENRTAHDIEILDNKIVAPKNKSIEHGYGLKNVTAILENINALYVFDYNSQKHLFSFSAQFPISR